jgi:hypothetical protein
MTGSMGELTPVIEIDGREIGYLYSDMNDIPAVSASMANNTVSHDCRWPITSLLQYKYRELTETEGLPIP